MRLLIVDDERGISTFVGFVARDRGWTAAAAVDAAEFRIAFLSDRPDAIILDLQLGSADGVEQLRFLAEQGFKGGLVLISGFDRRVLAAAEQRAQSLGLWVAAIETKPLHVKQLQEILEILEARFARVTDLPASAAPRETPPPPAQFAAGEIRDAIANGELELFFQPIVEAADRRPSHLEALARWRQPTFGLVAPDRFIPAAEREPKLIDALTEWAIGAAVTAQRQLAAAGHDIPVAVNLSAVNLRSLSFPDDVTARIHAAGASCSNIAFELTESAALEKADEILEILTRLRLKGFDLLIDDFGIGYSSLAALHQLPFTTIKLDRAFIADITASKDSFAIVKSVVDLARHMGLSTIAEGVETAETAELLADMGVTRMQGYHFSRPLPLAEIGQWLDGAPVLARHEASAQRAG